MDTGRSHSDPSPLVRLLGRADAARLAQIDHRLTGRSRGEWYRRRLERALAETDVNVSLGAELDGQLVGAVLGSIHYGEYGQAEPVAIVDTVLVDPGFQHRGVATALVEQFEKNVGALRVERLRTEVDWTERDLLGLFAKAGFAPGKRLVLERRVGDPGREEVGQVPHGQGPGTAGHP